MPYPPAPQRSAIGRPPAPWRSNRPSAPGQPHRPAGPGAPQHANRGSGQRQGGQRQGGGWTSLPGERLSRD